MSETTTPTTEDPQDTRTDEPQDTRTDVEKLRDRQLKAGEATGRRKQQADRLAKGTPVEQRAGVLGTRLHEGRVDNMSRRSDADPLMGHFVLIDFGDEQHGSDARAAVEAIIGEGNAGVGSGDYGVFVGVGETDAAGYPVTITVLLRDEHAAQVSGIPYGACRPSAAGGRR